eukprot:NODE_2251_length_968_cov_278.419496.p1 GENE.NODE_2251_length_968_cov_278.419496~~NODE_2251_length_968_cov_278.419496.p1  ORF type:complete len:251 (+),score=64.63 NODE_2251_length_968_cov_278.419496:3-755(+)
MGQLLLANRQVGDLDETFVMSYFGTTARTMAVLAMCVTGGMDWGDVAEPLNEISVAHSAVFTTYIAIAILGVLNVVTGIFVDSATKNVQKDAEHMMLLEMNDRLEWMEELAKAFEDADVDHEGRITVATLKQYVSTGNVRGYLRSVGLDVTSDNVGALFRCIDFDGDGYLSIREFIEGCAQLAGNARQLDLARVHSKLVDTNRVVRQLAGLPRNSRESESMGPSMSYCRDATTTEKIRPEDAAEKRAVSL